MKKQNVSSAQPKRTRRVCVRGVALAIVALATALTSAPPVFANPPNGKVVFQAFWWDCLNRSYQTDPDGTGGWYTYLAKLSPRLRDMGFDGIWIPPACKGAEGRNGMGYSLFDHYDLGQKFQKQTTGTRFGNQDEFLRMIAVAHSCGLEVYADIVLAHLSGGAEDPGSKLENKPHKLFHYRGYAGSSIGRWPKSWLDFHPNPHHSSGSDEWRIAYFGPDVCYHGRCCDNDCEHAGTYMLDHAREWFSWFKKQTDVDGFRFDAVKHFQPEVIEQLLSSAMWGAEPKTYFSVGEFVVGKNEQHRLDKWASETRNLCGTFDFAFRDALREMVHQRGFFDLGSLPNFQQSNRTKTVPFVNNHDTFRGVFSDSGGNGKDNHTGDQKNGDELFATINPDDDWTKLAYAAAFAIDGSPQVYYEDLFKNDAADTREKSDPKTLPTRSYVENIVWCHQKLNFKDGDYLVRYQGSQDLLVIERRGKALIALNDNGAAAVPENPITVQTGFGPRVLLHDYSGSVTKDQSTDEFGRITIQVPPKAYCVWAPAGISGDFVGHPRRTTQEFQMNDDLGDGQTESLGYGGHLVPSAFRTAGAIWVKGGSWVDVSVYSDEQRPLVVRVLGPGAKGGKSASVYGEETRGVANANTPLSFRFRAGNEGYYQLAAKVANAGDPAVRAYLKIEYEAPAETNLF